MKFPNLTGLQKVHVGDGFTVYVDDQGNQYTPTYGGEMNDLISLQGYKDGASTYYDANGNFTGATSNPFDRDGKQYVTDYSPSGQTSTREYKDSGWNDFLDMVKFLGPAILAGNIGSLSGLGEAFASSNAAALPSLAEAGTTLADLGLESLGASEAMGPTLAELTGSTGPLTGLEQYAAMPEGLGAAGGNISGSEGFADDALAADNIDVGGGWNPATGAGDAATAGAAAATGVTESAGLTPAQTYMGNTVDFPSVPEAPVDATANEGSLAKSTSDSGFFNGMTNGEKLAAMMAANAIATKLTTPKMPQAATGFTYESDNKPNYDIKFDDPVHWADIKVPEFKLSDTVTSPYFSQFKTGQAQGPMLDSGNEAYKSALIKGLRDASAMPSFVNPGFVNFATTK